MATSNDIPASALAVYAHPDDPEISAGGTLAKWAAAGAVVWVLITTRGDKGTTDPAADTDALARLRVAETAAAADLLGFAGHFHLDHPDGELPDDHTLRGDITRYVRELRPEVVLCPDPTAVFFGDGYVNHRDHRVVGFALLDSVSPASASPLYFPDAGPPHRVGALLLSGTLEADCYVDISTSLTAKAAALRCHASQLAGAEDWVDDLVEGRAHEAGHEAGIDAAEAFRRITSH